MGPHHRGYSSNVQFGQPAERAAPSHSYGVKTKEEEKQAGGKFFFSPVEVKVDKKGVNVSPTDWGKAWVFGLIEDCVP
ncbi:hypothetical protein CRENBAI_003689 [Crenichthys baileyi]|uniref:Uncharacterized protein n=1 Tax=Crenichthys baileyi TaxID=28760 RepID=A0AAV9R3V5_9TELE